MVRLFCSKKLSAKKTVFGGFFIFVITGLLQNLFHDDTGSSQSNFSVAYENVTTGQSTTALIFSRNVLISRVRNDKDRLLTLRYWDLVNSSSSRGFSNFVLPNLWRPLHKYLSSDRDDDRVLAQLVWAMEFTDAGNGKGSQSKVKKIVLTNTFSWWNRPNWKKSYILDHEECPGMPGLWGKCVFSHRSAGNFSSIDALITNRNLDNYPDQPDMLKFYYQLESPHVSYATFTKTNQLMATFYRPSDINTPYGKWVYYDPAAKFKNQGKDYSAGKSKMAAIFISNCYALNNRLGYVTELKKHINVDVIGSCGLNICPRDNEMQCFKMLKKEYRFYLAFENANCRDYVTEKLFMNAFENDVIPIVLGAHPQDYQAMCPEKSYIHIEDFAGPEELARYMQYLADNPREYNAYFTWKGTGTFLNTRFFCRVCAMVHYADVVPPPKRKLKFVWAAKRQRRKENLMEKELCLSNDQWYWTKITSLPNYTSTDEIIVN